MYISLYITIALLFILVTLSLARKRFSYPCAGREELIALGVILSIIWPIGVPLVIFIWLIKSLFNIIGILWSTNVKLKRKEW